MRAQFLLCLSNNNSKVFKSATKFVGGDLSKEIVVFEGWQFSLIYPMASISETNILCYVKTFNC